ncbi:hypothetical protein C0J52_01525 [Blattella germanica]|nr:hypothetical protein C0J52_01525 [Blattella germanica]
MTAVTCCPESSARLEIPLGETSWAPGICPRKSHANWVSNEINKPRKSRLAAWERRSSHVPLTTPGMVVSTRDKNGKKPDVSHLSKLNNQLEKNNNDNTLIRRIHSASSQSAEIKQLSAHNKNNKCINSHIGSQDLSNPLKISTPPIVRTPPKTSSPPTVAPPPKTSTPPDIPPTPPKSSKSSSPLIPPLGGAYSNFQIARKLHRENLEHKPLPDTVQDALYKSLQANKIPHPGRNLRVGTPRVSAVGYRGYGASGPSQCSKLRVYRPKTAHEPEKKPAEDSLPRRPSTARVSDMHLAICWDLKPEDQPKLSPHIDGSNGSAAPAVFALVHQPQPEYLINTDKDNGVLKGGCEGGNGCGTPNDTLTCPPKGNCGTKEGCGTPPFKNGRPKSAWKETKENKNPNMDRRHRSSPNLSVDQNSERRQLGSRPCIACELKDTASECPPHSNYKMAFKAGKPSNSFDSGSSRPQTAKPVKVPKPRAPFAKRSYSIDTLAPPFSLWPGHTGQDYPEHWRLASVYQHAYKPIETRRKPLLASVYQ